LFLILLFLLLGFAEIRSWSVGTVSGILRHQLRR
jgi:hypothetical protein